jgi:hypothetical protein
LVRICFATKVKKRRRGGRSQELVYAEKIKPIVVERKKQERKNVKALLPTKKIRL